MPKGLVLLLCCLLSSRALCAEVWPQEDWPRGSQASGSALQALEDYAFPARDDKTREGVRTDALLVIKEGRVVYERYTAPTRADTAHLTWSISKSLMATVLGVAYGQGRFHLQDRAARFYPPMAAHPDVTIADLLHWASGLDWQEDYEYAPLNSSVVAMLYTQGAADMAGYAAAHRSFGLPGQVFRYSSGDSNLLAATLRGMLDGAVYDRYPWAALFEPLGIRSAVWETDAQGTFVASSYAYLTARDLARVGLLMQREGRWRGQQLLPVAWVHFNRQPFEGYRAGQDEAVAGGHWWLNRAFDGGTRPWPAAPADTFAALGHWGQALYVLPAAGLVVVRYGDDRDGSYRHNELLSRVLAAFIGQVQP